MGMLKFEVPHALGKDEARKRTEALLKYWSSKYGVQTNWNGDSATMSGKVMGLTLTATLSVAEAKIGGEATDPGFLFRAQAREYLTRKFSAYLDPRADLVSLERGEA
jgi:hypothetical protein